MSETMRRLRTARRLRDLHTERNALSVALDREATDHAEAIRQRDEARVVLAALLGCIDTAAADNGPPVTRGSMMAQVCKVLQRTLQYDEAVRLLGRREGETP